MLPEGPITSTKNPVVRRFRASAEGADPATFVADGQRLVAEGLRSPLRPVEAIWSRRLLQRPGGASLLTALGHALPPSAVIECTDEVLARASTLQSQQGVLCCFKRPDPDFRDLLAAGKTLIVAAAGIQDPGNLGALVRTAEAAAATGFVAIGGADPYRDKCVRGTAGSLFRLVTIAYASPDRLVELAHRENVEIVAVDSGDGDAVWDADLRGPMCLLFGSEGAGIPDDLRSVANRRLRIPIAASVESLNVAVAAGIVLFEVQRQRWQRS